MPILLQNALRTLIERMTDRISPCIDASTGNLGPKAGHGRNRFLLSIARTGAKILLQQNLPLADSAAARLNTGQLSSSHDVHHGLRRLNDLRGL